MKVFFRSILLISIILWTESFVSAQEDNSAQMPVKVSIPPVSMVSFAGSKTNLKNSASKQTEQFITSSTIDTTWLNYSSIIDGNSTNSICVNINSGSKPTEVEVKMNIGEDMGAGAGKLGKSTGQILLNEYPQTIITDIGTCYTGMGPGKGHQLTYSWEWKPPYDVDHSSFEDIVLSVICTLAAGK